MRIRPVLKSVKIVIAPDSFKESLSSEEVCRAVQKGVKKVFPKAEIISVPMADGGEGTMKTIVNSMGGVIRKCRVTAPLGNKVVAHYGLIDHSRTAVIEMAEASGLTLVPVHRRNPLVTTSFGTGELIRNAIDCGCKKIILTLGGIATNDGGAGIAQALGYRLLDENGDEIPRGAQGLKFLHKIVPDARDQAIPQTEFIAACDVKNPLCGTKGSAAVYGPQKGATAKMVKEIDCGLRHFAKIVRRDLKIDILNLPGSGAAGGAGAGVAAFLNAKLKSGIEIVMDAVQFEEKVKNADLVITGEGEIDRQTIFGKTPVGVAKIAKKHGAVVIALCGQIGGEIEKIHSYGIDAVFPICRGPITRQESVKHTGKLLEKTSEEAVRFFAAMFKNKVNQIAGESDSEEDVTMRKKVENELIMVSARQNAILEAVPDIIAEVDVNKIYTWANRAGIEFFGEDVIGKEASCYFEGEQKTYELVEPIFRGDSNVFYIESWQRRRDGEKRLLGWWCRALKNSDGKVIGALSTARDMTENKKSEEALKKSSDEIYDLYNNAPCGYHSLDKDGVFVRINDTELSWLGYSRDELLNRKKFSDILTPKSAEIFKESFQQLMNMGSVRDVELEVIKKNGSTMFVFRSATVIRDPSGNFQMSCATLYDVTELKKTKDSLEKKALELAVSNKDLEQLIFAASHDLKSPVRILINYLQLLEKKQKEKIDEQSRHYIERVIMAASRMNALINDLVEYLNLRQRRDDVIRVDCAEILKSVLEDLKDLIDGCGAAITIDPLPNVIGIESEIRSLFLNLVGNAVKYRKGVSPHVHLSARKEKEEWIFSVQDDGIGIDPQYSEKIFMVFHRLYTQDQYPGTGIGLAICKRIVELYGGRIWVESQPGQGATFYFALPNKVVEERI